ncbi:actin-like family protein, partial [Cystoisospora suis]
MSSLSPALVLDNGSGCLKAGFAGESYPIHTLPTCVGQGRDRQKLNQNFLYGDELLISSNYFCLRPTASASSPLFSDLELLRDLWEILLCHKKYFGFSDFALSNNGVVVTEPLLTPAAIRDALSEILFEDFKFNQVLFAPTQQSVPFAFLGSRVQDAVEQEGKAWSDLVAGKQSPSSHSENHRSLDIIGNCPRYSGPKKTELEGFGTDYPCGGTEDGAVYTRQRRLSQQGSGEERQLNADRSHCNGLEGAKNSHPQSTSMHHSDMAWSSTTGFLNGRKEGQFFSGLVVDCGFSGTTVMPYVDLRPVERAALRTGVGGNLLTTVLKNLCGFRSINLERNELLVQHIKESCCFVSEDFDRQLLYARREAEAAGSASSLHRTHLFREFELPEYGTLP